MAQRATGRLVTSIGSYMRHTRVPSQLGGLRFLCTFTLPSEWVVQMIPFGNRPKKLPVVLGQPEVHRLIECVTEAMV